MNNTLICFFKQVGVMHIKIILKYWPKAKSHQRSAEREISWNFKLWGNLLLAGQHYRALLGVCPVKPDIFKKCSIFIISCIKFSSQTQWCINAFLPNSFLQTLQSKMLTSHYINPSKPNHRDAKIFIKSNIILSLESIICSSCN